MRLAIVTVSVAALALGAWAAEAADSAAPECSALDTQRHVTLYGGGYERYCGPGRAVVRVEGTSFAISGGNCSGPANRRSFGLFGRGSSSGKGIWLRLEPVTTATGRHRWLVRPRRVGVMDGEVQLPGFTSLPHQGTAFISNDLKSATFSLGSPTKIRGSWTCR
jgi:hypothetical protein